MPKDKKSDEEINKILKELRDLKIYDNELYKEKITALKKEHPDTYFKIIILLNMEGNAQYSSSASSQIHSMHKPEPKMQDNIQPSLKPVIQPAQKPIAQAPKPAAQPKPVIQSSPKPIPPKPIPIMIKPNAQQSPKPLLVNAKLPKKSNPLGSAIMAMIFIGILVVGVIGAYLLLNPPQSDTSRNSLRLGHSLFYELNNTYLNYTYQYTTHAEDYIREQYYLINNSKATSALVSPNKNIISIRQNGNLYYDLAAEPQRISTGAFRANNILVTSIYDEIYNIVNNYKTEEYGRENVWNLTNIPCAPLYFEVDVSSEEFSDLSELRYEMCLSNDGIPVAIAKESKYVNEDYELIVVYLENMNSEVGDLIFLDKTLSEWSSIAIDDL